MKKVAFNALVMSETAGGLGVYIKQVMDELLFNKQKFKPVVYLSETWCEKNPKYSRHPNVKCISIPTGNPFSRTLLEPFMWPRLLKKDKVDLFFSPMSYIPLGVNIPGIITIHDLRSFHYPDYYTFFRYHYLHWSIKRSARIAKKIIAVSNYTRDDIKNHLDVNNPKISVIYEGVNQKMFSAEYKDDVKNDIMKKYNLEKPFILSVGHLEPRKNFIRLIEAFNILKKEYSIKHDLLITGQENWYYKDIYSKVKELGLDNSVKFTNFVKQEYIPALYQLADVYVTISTFEGFGFTPLESMCAGTPVVSSNCTSLPEIVGDAALMCDPYNVREIAMSIYRLLTDQTLGTHYVERGIQHVKKFKWEECLHQTMKELELYA